MFLTLRTQWVCLVSHVLEIIQTNLCTLDVLRIQHWLAPIWCLLFFLFSNCFMCCSYQDLSGMNFKLTLQERSFLILWCVISSEQGRMWCTCEKRHQLRKAPHSQGSHTIISLRPTQTLTKGMNQTKPSGEGRKGKIVCVHGLMWLAANLCLYTCLCVCVECIWHSWTLRMGNNKHDKTVSEGKE